LRCATTKSPKAEPNHHTTADTGITGVAMTLMFLIYQALLALPEQFHRYILSSRIAGHVQVQELRDQHAELRQQLGRVCSFGHKAWYS
jgi:hypothetical protein